MQSLQIGLGTIPRVAISPPAFCSTSAAPGSAFVVLGVGAHARREFFYLAAYFRCFAAAAICEEIGVLVVSAKAEPLKQIAAIETARNFIVRAGSQCWPEADITIFRNEMSKTREIIR